MTRINHWFSRLRSRPLTEAGSAGLAADRSSPDVPVVTTQPAQAIPVRNPVSTIRHETASPVDGFSLVREGTQTVLMHSSGSRRPLRRDRAEVDDAIDGWTLAAIHVEYAPILIAFVSHGAGTAARWIIDVSNEVHEAALSDLPDRPRSMLSSATTRLLHEVRWHGAVALADWNRLPRTTRLELLANTQFGAKTGQDSVIAVMGAWGHDTGRRLDVCSADDMLSVVLPSQVEIPILQGAKPLRHSGFLPGWTAETLYRDFAPFYLLELRHESGVRAAWVLDRDCSLIADVLALDKDRLDALCVRAAPVIDRHLGSVLEFADPSSDPVVARYLELSDAVRHTLVGHGAASIRTGLIPLGVQQMPEMLTAFSGAGRTGLVVLRRSSVEQAVTTDVHRRTLEATFEGPLQWPSPVDASPSPLCGIFTLDDYVFVYQFADRNGLDFLVIVSDRSCRLIGVVVPAVNMILFDDRDPAAWTHDNWLRGNRGAGFWPLLIHHINRYPNEMARRSRTPEAVAVNVLLTDVHIGHHLWNDLSGIEALCDAIPAALLPTTMIIGASDGHAELFGPIDRLFPATIGHVDRSLPDVDSFIRWTYGHDVWPTRITRAHISKALRHRVMRHLAEYGEATTIRANFASRGRSGQAPPVVVFGLRVEDRTMVDLQAFCEAFVAFMVERHPGSVIIFDGHNSRPGDPSGAVIKGMAYTLAHQPPEQVEAAIVASLASQYDTAPVTIIGTIGQSIVASLAWCREADAAFVIWGAGLAKYRWLANLPTLMVTNRVNIESRFDRMIYHDAAFMEAPSPAVFADPALITDMPEHSSLASRHIQGGRECFKADTNSLLLQFDMFLAGILRENRGVSRQDYR